MGPLKKNLRKCYKTDVISTLVLLMDKKNVCIIGAGIGGLTAGALLTKNGYKVKIFEKETLIGGRALSFDASSLTLEEYNDLLSRFHMNVPFSEPDLETIFNKKMLNGYTLDLGFHSIGVGALLNINSVLSDVDVQIEMFESKLGFIKERGFDFPFLSRLDKLMMFPRTLQVLLANESTLKKMDNMSMKETVERYGRGKMKLVLEIFSRVSSTVNNLSVISTGEVLRAQKNLLRGKKIKYLTVGYPKNGLISLSMTLADFIKRNCGEILVKTPVSKIIIDDNKAKGVIAGGKEYNFDAIVSNILVQDLFNITDEKHFPGEYVKNIKSLTGTGSLCAYYSLKKVDPNLLGKTFLFIERDVGVDGGDVVGMIDFMTASPSSGVAPPSHYLIQSYIICTPKEAKNKRILENLKELLDGNLEKLIPDLHSQLRWALYPAVWHLDGVAKTIDNIKPDIRTPVNNLYLAGDCVKAPGIGINCALNSAQMLKELLTQKNS